MVEDSKASCCPSTLPAVTTHDYKPKGKWEKLGGLDVYVISPPKPTRAIMAVYDIFGAMPQTMQGCDMLSTATHAAIFMPDYFEGEPLSMSAFPPDTDEKKKIIEQFRATKTTLEPNVQRLKTVIAAAKERDDWKHLPWGGYGLCWGGKITVLSSGKDTPFKATAQAHPGRLAVEDVEALTIPHICLFSKEDGSPELVEEYGKALKDKNEKNVVEKYGTMVHGWMAARSNFAEAEVVKEFERGYGRLAEFFAKCV